MINPVIVPPIITPIVPPEIPKLPPIPRPPHIEFSPSPAPPLPGSQIPPSLPPPPIIQPPQVNEEPVLNVLEIAPGLAVEIRFINGNWKLIPTKAPPDVEGMIINDLAKEIQLASVSPYTEMTYDQKCCLINALANRRDSLINAWRNVQGLLATDKPTPLTELPPIALLTPEDQVLNELPTTEDTGIEEFDQIDYRYKPEKDKIILLQASGVGRGSVNYVKNRFDVTQRGYSILNQWDISQFEDTVLIVCGVMDVMITDQMYNRLFNELAHIPKLILDTPFARVIGVGVGWRAFGRGQLINQIEIVNNSHPITQGLPLGPYDVGSQMYSAILELAPEYISLAELTFTGGIIRPKSILAQAEIEPGFPPTPGEIPIGPYTVPCFAISIGDNIGYWGLWNGDPLLDRMIDFMIPAGQGCSIELTQTYYDHKFAMINEIVRDYHKPYPDKSMLQQIALEEIINLDQMRLNAQLNAPQWVKGMDILEGYKTVEIDWSVI